MTTRKCLACGQYFKPWPQTPEQSYCSKQECQRERRRRAKQKERLVSSKVGNPHEHNGTVGSSGYWKDYRANNPDYVERNRHQQKQRNRSRPRLLEVTESGVLQSGRYLLARLDSDGIANGDEWIVEIRVLSAFPGNG